YGQVFNVYPDQYLLLFALGGLACILNYDSTGRVSWLVWCGLSTGAGVLFKYNVGVLLLGAGTLAVATRELMLAPPWWNSLKVASIYIGSFGVVAVGFVIYLLATRSFGAMVNHFLHHAAEYSESRSVSLPSPAEVMPALMIWIPLVLFGFLVLFLSRRMF